MSLLKVDKKYGGSLTDCIIVDVVIPLTKTDENIGHSALSEENSKFYYKESILYDNFLNIAKDKVSVTFKKKVLAEVPRKVPNRIVKGISEGISFSESVVEERSPHTIPFSQCKIDEIYRKITLSKKKKKHSDNFCSKKNGVSLPPISLLNNKTNTKDVPVNNLENQLSLESVLIGASDSSESMKPSSARRRTVKQPVYLNEKKIPKQTWEQYVLSQLSNTATKLILKDKNPIHMSEKHQTELKTERLDDLENKISALKLSQNNNQKKIDPSNVSYFANVPDQYKNLSAEKNMQNIYPCLPSKWFENEELEYNNTNQTGRGVTRGMKKWTEYPTFKEQEELVLQQISDTKLEKSVKLPVTKRKVSYNLVPVVNEWRTLWLAEKKFEQESLKDICEAMKDRSEHTRFAAVSAVAIVIMKDLLVETQELEIVLCEVTKLLDDDSHNVKLAAAVTLFSINKVSTEASNILMKTVCEHPSSERWVAIQCLVEYQYHDDCIIRELISVIVSGDVNKSNKAAQMLKSVSDFSMSVQYMLAEKLNSGSWKDRVVACQVLPTLHGKLTKDIANKLLYLLWNDWSTDVRKAAAEALGRSGNGVLVHNSLCMRLQSRNHNKQINALKKIVSFGIMTTHLLLPLISCLESTSDTVCLQAIKTCMKTKLSDEKIINALLSLLMSDHACKLRIYTIRALGCIGCKSPLIRDNLVWTLHFSKEAVLRKEACSAITKLELQDDEIVKVLQDLVFIDEDPNVRKEVVLALCSMGLEAVGDATLSETIERGVKRLCHKDNVIAHVVGGKGDDFSFSKEERDTSDSDEDDGDKEEDNDRDSSSSNNGDNVEDVGTQNDNIYKGIDFKSSFQV